MSIHIYNEGCFSILHQVKKIYSILIFFSGFRNLLKTHWKFAAKELYNGFVLSKTVESAKKFIPSLTAEDFIR